MQPSPTRDEQRDQAQLGVGDGRGKNGRQHKKIQRRRRRCRSARCLLRVELPEVRTHTPHPADNKRNRKAEKQKSAAGVWGASWLGALPTQHWYLAVCWTLFMPNCDLCLCLAASWLLPSGSGWARKVQKREQEKEQDRNPSLRRDRVQELPVLGQDPENREQ